MRTIPLLAGVFAVVLGAGCASTGHAPGTAPTASRFHVDTEHMAQIERVARQRGVQIEWVNPPQVRVDRRDR